MRCKQVVLVTLVVMVLFGCGADRDRQLVVDYQRAVYESLALQDALQQHSGGYAAADLGIGISNQGMSKFLSLLKGLVITPAQPPKGYEDLSVRIEDIQLVSRAGRSELEGKTNPHSRVDGAAPCGESGSGASGYQRDRGYGSETICREHLCTDAAPC